MQPVLKEPQPSSSADNHRQVQAALNPQVVGPYLAQLFPNGGHAAECRVLDMK